MAASAAHPILRSIFCFFLNKRTPAASVAVNHIRFPVLTGTNVSFHSVNKQNISLIVYVLVSAKRRRLLRLLNFSLTWTLDQLFGMSLQWLTVEVF